MRRKCNNQQCGAEYDADPRNLARGWGLCCSKSCAAKVREMSKPGYDPARVERNNARRESWNKPLDSNHYGDYRGGRTSEGYKIYGDTAVDEFGEPMYTVTGEDDPGDSQYYNGK